MKHTVSTALRWSSALLLLLLVLLGLTSSSVALEIPPTLKLPLFTGKTATLEQYRGKVVVLEWFNPDCPFVKKHYLSDSGDGNMPILQQRYMGKGVVWLTVNSTAADHPSYVAPERVAPLLEEWKMHPATYVVDASGEVGKAFGAKTTPHMFVLDRSGNVVYQGAIDDQPGVANDPKKAHSHLAAALDQVLAGKPVETAKTDAYGCSVKYAR